MPNNKLPKLIIYSEENIYQHVRIRWVKVKHVRPLKTINHLFKHVNCNDRHSTTFHLDLYK